MSEQKRVSFTTISSSSTVSFTAATTSVSSSGVPTAAASLRFGSDFLSAQDKSSSANATGTSNNERKVGGEINKTIRLKLELFQTDSCSYPEFNYSKLLHLEKKKCKKRKQKSNGFTADPFEENDDDVARIAKELEQKYGSSYSSGRGRSKKDDHCDIGLGYDESDSFIDNTEAYDEVIPEEVETIEGGFYINSGALEFKKLHTEAAKTKTDEIIKMPNRPRKRVLSSSSEDSSTTDEDDDDNSDEDGDDSGDAGSTTDAAAKNKNIIAPPAEKRQKTSNSTKKSSSHDTDIKKKSKTVTISGSSSNSPKPSPCHEIGSDSEKERVQLQKTIKTTTVKDMLKTKRDNFLKMQVGDSKSVNGELKGAATKSSDEESSSDDSDDSSNNSDSNNSAPQQEEKKTKKIINTEENSEKLRSFDTKLPELDSEVIISIQQFKEVVKSKNMTGKKFQFDDNLTEVFLKIDEALLCIDKTQRNMVFAHLEYNLLLPKYYFLRKAKQLRIKEEKLKSKRALAKLRKAVIEIMPEAIRNFEVELRKHADLQTGNLNSEHPPKMPKKKFAWTLDLRNYLYEVYQVRWTSYPVLRTRKETLEDFINVYMRDKVVELWPNGWMRYEELQKEIERRKAATKKTKEKKKDTTNNLSAANPTTVNVTPAVAVPSIQSSSTNTYIKQFEEFTTSSSRSCANSDTDSVASNSGTSNGIQRKNADNKNKHSKGKAHKSAALAVQQQTSATDLMSSSKRTDHSIHSIISPTMLPDPTTSTPILSSGSNSNNGSSQHSKQHSKSGERDARVPIIDLDNYKGTSAILQTTKQLSASAPTVSDSSSESDCVEITGVFPAKPFPATTSITTTNATTKKNKRNSAATSGNRNMSPLTNNAFNNNMETNSNLAAVNNNNIYNNNNSKKSGGVGATVTDFDVNEIVKVLKEESKGMPHSTFTPQTASMKDVSNQ